MASGTGRLGVTRTSSVVTTWSSDSGVRSSRLATTTSVSEPSETSETLAAIEELIPDTWTTPRYWSAKSVASRKARSASASRSSSNASKPAASVTRPA